MKFLLTSFTNRPKRPVLLWLVPLLALAGCVATQRIVWSPDGKHAAVIGGEGELYLSDSAGNLTGVLLSNVFSAAWFHDSERLALAHVQTCTNWNGLAALLPVDTRERIRAEAVGLLAQLKAEGTK